MSQALASPWSLPRFGAAPTISLLDSIAEGLPFDATDTLTAALSPTDPTFKYRLVPKATYARRKIARRLSPQESERLVRLARIWSLALDVWKDEDAARRFLTGRHVLLSQRTALDVALDSELGGKMVEELLARAAYSTAI